MTGFDQVVRSPPLRVEYKEKILVLNESQIERDEHYVRAKTNKSFVRTYVQRLADGFEAPPSREHGLKNTVDSFPRGRVIALDSDAASKEPTCARQLAARWQPLTSLEPRHRKVAQQNQRNSRGFAARRFLDSFRLSNPHNFCRLRSTTAVWATGAHGFGIDGDPGLLNNSVHDGFLR